MVRLHFSAILVLLIAQAASAGVVRTAAGPVEGKVDFAQDSITVAGKKIPWSDVLYLQVDAGKATPRPQRIILRNGESWTVDVLALKDNKLAVRSDLFGEQQIDLALIAEIDFVPQVKHNTPRKAGTLYRTQGSPVPGKLLSMDNDKIGVETILGVVNLPRREVSCLYFADPLSRPQVDGDEAGFIEGTLTRGQLRIETRELKLKHAICGEISAPVTMLASVVRHSPRVIDVTTMPLQSVQTLPLLGTVAEGAARYQVVRDRCPSPICKGLRIEPHTVARFQPAATSSGKAALRLTVQPLPGARGDTKLVIRNGAAVIWERELSASAAAVEVAVDVSTKDTLEFEVDFGARLRFPCGVVLGDPHLLLK